MIIKQQLAKVLMFVFRIFPIEKEKVVVDNFNGKGYGDSPKYIVEELLRQKKEYKIIWLTDKHTKQRDFPKEVKQVEFLSIRAFYELATAGFWIDNVRKPWFVLKRKGQFYIQTWHGGIALKQIEKDVEDNLPDSYLKDAKADSKKINIMLSNCRQFSELAHRSFWYDGEIMEMGLPRNDLFFHENSYEKQKVKQYYGIDKEKKIVLYAPTFRKDRKQKKTLEEKELIQILEKKFGGQWVFMKRLHPNEADQERDTSSYGKVYQATSYPDIQELLVAADVLVTDYSATMFEFAMMKKPVFLFTYDLEEYIKDRNFYYDLKELPFLLLKTQKEFADAIENFDQFKYEEKLKKFFAHIGLLETGRASKEIVKRMEIERHTGEKNVE